MSPGRIFEHRRSFAQEAGLVRCIFGGNVDKRLKVFGSKMLDMVVIR